MAIIDQGRLPAHGVEALICGSVECVQEHYTRAASIYQPLYSQQFDNGMALPSTIQVGPCVWLAYIFYAGCLAFWFQLEQDNQYRVQATLKCKISKACLGLNNVLTWEYMTA